MIILIGNLPLIMDKSISDEDYEKEVYQRNGGGWEFKRHIYLWNSSDIVRAVKNPFPLDLLRTIFVNLDVYNINFFENDFPKIPIMPPEQVISIDGSHSGIKHGLESVINICKTFEEYEIGCLVNPDKRPLLEHIEYCSKKIKGWLRDSFDIIEL